MDIKGRLQRLETLLGSDAEQRQQAFRDCFARFVVATAEDAALVDRLMQEHAISNPRRLLRKSTELQSRFGLWAITKNVIVPDAKLVVLWPCSPTRNKIVPLPQPTIGGLHFVQFCVASDADVRAASDRNPDDDEGGGDYGGDPDFPDEAFNRWLVMENEEYWVSWMSEGLYGNYFCYPPTDYVDIAATVELWQASAGQRPKNDYGRHHPDRYVMRDGRVMDGSETVAREWEAKHGPYPHPSEFAKDPHLLEKILAGDRGTSPT